MNTAVAAVGEVGRSRFWPLILLSIAGWVVLAASDGGLILPSICASGTPLFSALNGSVVMAWQLRSMDGLALSWSAMLAAMMPLLLLWPLEHIWARSLADRRVRAMGLFFLGYAGAWLFAMALLVLVSSALRMAMDRGTLSAFLIALGAAVVWQGSAIKRVLLNRCHALPSLPAFGAAAEWGSFKFGMETGLYCVGACWALMLLPLLAGSLHLAVMAAVAIFMLHERHATPKPARANLPLFALGVLLMGAVSATS